MWRRGIAGSVARAGYIAGPLSGSYLADRVGSRSGFVVKLPIGAAALAVVATVLPGSLGRRRAARRADPPGRDRPGRGAQRRDPG
jgi:MFS family permease